MELIFELSLMVLTILLFKVPIIIANHGFESAMRITRGSPTMGPYLSKTYMYTIHMNTRTHRQADKNKGWNNFIFEDSLNMNYCFIIYSFFCLCKFNAGINTDVLRCFKAILKVLKLCNVYHFMKLIPIYIRNIYICMYNVLFQY